METEMAQALLKLREDVDRAQRTAENAVKDISTHESICALRYETINAKLDVMPAIFTKLDGMAGKVSLATGVWIGVLGIGGVLTIVYAVLRLTGHG